MATDREQIFERITKALDPLKSRTPMPEWSDDLPYSAIDEDEKGDWARFCRRFALVNGVALEGLEQLVLYLDKFNLKRGYCDPYLLEHVKAHPGMASRELVTEFPKKLEPIDAIEFGITRASGAIAETGTVVLSDKETSDRLAALAPWTHIALLAKERLYPNVLTAVKNLGDDPSVIWCTGPSKTADVEGILIEGVHGPGAQVCVLFD